MTALELLERIYGENDSHVALMAEMTDCDCRICVALDVMATYLEQAGELEAREGDK